MRGLCVNMKQNWPEFRPTQWTLSRVSGLDAKSTAYMFLSYPSTWRRRWTSLHSACHMETLWCSSAWPHCDKLWESWRRPVSGLSRAAKQLLHQVTATPTAAGSTYCSSLPEKASQGAQRHLSRVSPERPSAPLSHNSSQSVTKMDAERVMERSKPRGPEKRSSLSWKLEEKLVWFNGSFRVTPSDQQKIKGSWMHSIVQTLSSCKVKNGVSTNPWNFFNPWTCCIHLLCSYQVKNMRTRNPGTKV